jgi:flagellar hook assembly protein FlgD
MKKFMALYLAPVSAVEQMAKSTPEQMKSGMDAWMKWMDKNKTSISELGAPLGKTKRVTKQGVEATKNEVTGYSIVQADSHDAAAKLFDGHPHLYMPGASIEIMEVMPIPGM